MNPPSLTKANVEAAAALLTGHVHRTPVATSRFFDDAISGHVFFKCENLQRMGAFKFRGAMHAVLRLIARDPKAAERGLVTHSSGNHAQAVALAARINGLKATIVMPRTTAAVKIAAVRGYGGEIVWCEDNAAARHATAAQLVASTGAHLLHPYDDDDVIAGQGTACLELLRDRPRLDFVLAPVSGGGLLAGTALAAEGSGTAVIGAEPEQANDAALSMAAGHIVTIPQPSTVADGLRVTSVGTRNFSILKRLVREILTVSEAEILAATRLFIERTKLVIEPSSATAVAVLLKHKDRFRGRQVGVILSGGNVDLKGLAALPD
jgi:threonine dehydratase